MGIFETVASKRGYARLENEEEEEAKAYGLRIQRSPRAHDKWLLCLFASLLLGLSNVGSWYTSKYFTIQRGMCNSDTRTPYAGLQRNKPVAMGEHNLYTDYNESLRTKMWESINIDDGMIALPDSYVDQKALPKAQRFPWDITKGIYLVNGHHNLHCARAVYISLMEFKQGKPQSRLWSHVIHCIDALRQEVICNADDTPRYSTADDNPESGVGQVRQCRDWDQLEAWVKQYNACYRYINQTDTIEELPGIERFIFCPEGSPYVVEVEKYFSHVE